MHQHADLVHGSETVMLSSRGGGGEIRPHGILLATEEHDLSIVIASANAVELGIDPTKLIGRVREWPKPLDPPDLIARLSGLVGRTARRT